MHFLFGVWSVGVKRIEGRFDYGRHLIEWAYRIQKYSHTSTVAPRFHLKTTIHLAYIAWMLFKNEQRYLEWLYMAYKEDLAEYQIKRAKRIIAAIPEYFSPYVNITKADGVMHYLHGDTEFICEPCGILAFKRGRHPYGLTCDDILKDPKARLDIGVLDSIKKTFLEEVYSMPTHQLHVAGTPQDRTDLFATLDEDQRFNSKRYKGIIDEAAGVTLWPEVYQINRLQELRRSLGIKAFNKEIQCEPVRSEEAFITEAKLNELINPRLKNYSLVRVPKLNTFTVGGFDIGKKAHPSHLALYAVKGEQMVQVMSKWMDGWDYVDQLDFLKQVIKSFKTQKLLYDDTRAEFESFKESGSLPGEMKGVPFTAGTKFSMATEFDKMATQKTIVLLDDPRQTRQILNVDNDLKAVESEEGHGDSFFSTCLAVRAFRKGKVRMIWELN